MWPSIFMIFMTCFSNFNRRGRIAGYDISICGKYNICLLGGGFTYFSFHSYLGKMSILTDFFQGG